MNGDDLETIRSAPLSAKFRRFLVAAGLPTILRVISVHSPSFRRAYTSIGTIAEDTPHRFEMRTAVQSQISGTLKPVCIILYDAHRFQFYHTQCMRISGIDKLGCRRRAPPLAVQCKEQAKLNSKLKR
jgi:hypothetical protein